MWNLLTIVVATIIPIAVGYVVVWRTVLKDELIDMKLIRDP